MPDLTSTTTLFQVKASKMLFPSAYRHLSPNLHVFTDAMIYLKKKTPIRHLTVSCYFFYKFSLVSIEVLFPLYPSPAAEQAVDGAGDEKAHEPGIVVRRDKCLRDTR